MAEDKPNPPSRKRLERSRRDGRVLKAQLFSSVTSVLAGLLALYLVLSFGWVKHRMLLEYCLLGGFRDVQGCGAKALGLSVRIVCVTLGASAIFGSVFQALQTRSGFYPHLALPRWDRINPAAGFHRMLKGFKDIPFLAITVLIIGLVFALFVQSLLGQGSETGWAGFDWTGMRPLGTQLLSIAAGLAAFDLWRKYRQYYRELGMSHDELRQELKDDEGHPHIRARRRAIHAAISREEMVARIRRTRVVVVQKT